MNLDSNNPALHEEVICCFCNSADSNRLYPTSDLTGKIFFIYKCNNCKADFLSPKPDQNILNKAYDSSYYGRGQNKFAFLIENLVDYYRFHRAKTLHKFLKSTKNPKVLDIGCGNGMFLSHLLRLGHYELYGTELKGESADRAAQIPEINLKLGNIQVTDYDAKYFDAITLFHVFEHLTEPKLTLEAISGLIKKSGILKISFPNTNSLQSRLFKGKWFHIDPPRHLFFFKPADFIKLMKTYNFQILNTRYISVEQNPFGMIQSILNVFCKKKDILYERLKGNTTYAPEYSKYLIFLQRLFFIVTFPIFTFTDIIGSIIKTGATVEFTFRKQ